MVDMKLLLEFSLYDFRSLNFTIGCFLTLFCKTMSYDKAIT